jgi:hypothetical protein
MPEIMSVEQRENFLPNFFMDKYVATYAGNSIRATRMKDVYLLLPTDTEFTVRPKYTNVMLTLKTKEMFSIC